MQETFERNLPVNSEYIAQNCKYCACNDCTRTASNGLNNDILSHCIFFLNAVETPTASIAIGIAASNTWAIFNPEYAAAAENITAIINPQMTDHA